MGMRRKKRRSVRGESFVELLIAVLIVAFGCAIIATMFAVSLGLNKGAREKDDEYYRTLTEMEQGLPTGEKAPVEIDDGSGSENGKITVETELYGEGGLFSYRKEGE